MNSMNKLFSLGILFILLVSCGDTSQGIPSSSLSSSSEILLSSSESSLSSSSSSSVSSSSSSSSSSISSSSSSSQPLNLQGINQALFAYLGDLPETESFLPSFMYAEEYISTKEVQNLDYYAGAVNRNQLPTKYFGAQLDQLWTHLGYVSNFTQGLTTMLAHASELGDLYSDYLSGNPANPYAFSITLGGFAFSIIGLEEELVLTVTVGSMSVNMAVLNIQNRITYWVDLMINENNRLLISTTDQELTVVSHLEVPVTETTSVQVSYLLNVTKNNGMISGFSYERYGVGNLALRNHLVFKSTGDYFTVAGERGDFLPGSQTKVNVETYRISDGHYLGSEVLEDLPAFEPYETIWYPLWNIQGWNTIRFEADNEDEKSFPQVYLNDSLTPFDVHYNTVTILFITQKTDRKYDIELKRSYVYQENEEGKFEKVEFLYPAFFIQEKELVTGPFGTANSRNNDLFSHSLTLNERNAIQNHYDELKVSQANYKQVDVDAIIVDLFSDLSK